MFLNWQLLFVYFIGILYYVESAFINSEKEKPIMTDSHNSAGREYLSPSQSTQQFIRQTSLISQKARRYEENRPNPGLIHYKFL